MLDTHTLVEPRDLVVAVAQLVKIDFDSDTAGIIAPIETVARKAGQAPTARWLAARRRRR